MAPYREDGGTSCPRCDQRLTASGDGCYQCDRRCGEWLPNDVIEKTFGTLDLRGFGAKTSPYGLPRPLNECLFCDTPMTALFVEAENTVVLALCPAHGVWVDKKTREDLANALLPNTASYAAALERQRTDARSSLEAKKLAARKLLQLEQKKHEREAQLAALLRDDPVEAARRILALEDQVAELRSDLVVLQRSLAKLDR